MTKTNSQQAKQTPKNKKNNANKPKKNKNKNKNVNNVNNENMEKSAQLVPVVTRPQAKLRTTKMSLTKCAMKFAIACADPFAPSARGSCVPVGNEPTMKVCGFTRFDLVIGTSGLAIAVVCPTLLNDVPICFFTNSTFSGNTGTAINPFATYGNATTSYALSGTWSSQTMNNLPFNSGQMQTSNGGLNEEGIVYGRIVSGGMRAQYTGTTLNESGVYSCFTSPHHSSVAGLSYTSTVSSQAEAVIRAVDRKPCMVRWYPITDIEQQITPPEVSLYTSSMTYPFSENGWLTSGTPTNPTTSFVYYLTGNNGTIATQIGCPISVLYITGVAGMTVHMELIQHVEYAGPPASTMLTPVTADIEGTQQVVKAASAMPAKLQAMVSQGEHEGDYSQSMWSVMYDSLKEVAHESITYGVPALVRGVASLVV